MEKPLCKKESPKFSIMIFSSFRLTIVMCNISLGAQIGTLCVPQNMKVQLKYMNIYLKSDRITISLGRASGGPSDNKFMQTTYLNCMQFPHIYTDLTEPAWKVDSNKPWILAIINLHNDDPMTRVFPLSLISYQMLCRSQPNEAWELGRPSLTMLRWKINGWTDQNKNVTTNIIQALDCDIVCLYDTHLKGDTEL